MRALIPVLRLNQGHGAGPGWEAKSDHFSGHVSFGRCLWGFPLATDNTRSGIFQFLPETGIFGNPWNRPILPTLDLSTPLKLPCLPAPFRYRRVYAARAWRGHGPDRASLQKRPRVGKSSFFPEFRIILGIVGNRIFCACHLKICDPKVLFLRYPLLRTFRPAFVGNLHIIGMVLAGAESRS